MSLHPRSGEQVPSLTAQIARASNPGGTTAMWVRDRLDGLWHDEDFVGSYPRDGRPGLSPAQLATVCVLQFVLGLSDRQAAEAVRCRMCCRRSAQGSSGTWAGSGRITQLALTTCWAMRLSAG
ncbi:transposase [Streptomyces sp. TP-A0356]|uniref:transposase n=1 Tax=Streptomyces sp. TP-A0356 TaxID=1359208 RepID=UPI001F1CAE17|nr:transposase [Streptomyces sp. TP-A0356]